jgi:hypothetical protein
MRSDEIASRMGVMTAELAQRGFLNERGNAFSAASVSRCSPLPSVGLAIHFISTLHLAEW